jgi:O-antigen/teichoic acid export membrane protein
MDISRNDVYWSYIGQVFQYGSSALILPIALSTLTDHDLSIWFVFIAITSFVSLLDSGIQPSTSRFATYIFSGADTILKTGFNISYGNEINYKLLKSLIFTLKKIYTKIAIIALFILLIPGTFYVFNFINFHHNFVQIILAWILLLISNVISLYYGYYNSLLQGRGYIVKYNKLIVYTKLTFLLISILLLFLGFGLLGISIASIISNIINRILAYNYFYDEQLNKEFSLITDFKPDNIFQTIWYNSKKTGVVAIGVFMLGQFNILISSYYLSANEVSSLGLLFQLFLILQNLSRVYFNTFLPRFNSLRVSNNSNVLIKDFKKAMYFSWLSYLIGLILLLTLGNYFLDLINSNTKLPSSNLILLFAIVYLMEITHGNCALFLTTKNNIPFVKSTIITGIIHVLVTFLLLNFSDFGIYTFPLSLIFVQFLYNSWKWPLEVFKDLRSIRNNE